ncbi:hypothetical protein EVAR_39767_1 [Eumeta japonica]|uniref:Uncharacterized protein n=1 Tax=Eumeta variegata TaxID=151549 RepID=A0A4C1X2W2_EUMVA|nr:hypothetical protein EVAR_39767_1 [Eumeta japonica]
MLFCYAPVTERPTKIGIRGLPVDTAPNTIITAMQELGFPAEYARPIPPRKGRPGCLFYARLGHTNQDGLQRLRSGIHRRIATGRSDAYVAAKVTWWPTARGPGTKNPCAQTDKALTRQATRDVRPLEEKLAKEGSRSPPPIPAEQDPTTLHRWRRRGQGAEEARRLDATAPSIMPQTMTAPQEEEPEPGPSTAVLEPPQNWRDRPERAIPTKGLRAAKRSTEGRRTERQRRRRIDRFPLLPPPHQFTDPPTCLPTHAYPGSRPGAPLMMMAPQATRTEQPTSQIAVTLPQTMPLTRLQHQGMPPMGPLTFARPPARVTRGPQQLMPLTWVQARMMEALRAVLTGQDSVTALLQILLLDPAEHTPTSE